MSRYSLILFFGILCFSGISMGQEKPWSLQECIEYAVNHNIQIKQSEINAEISKASMTQSKANMLPSFNAFASNTYNWGQTIDPFTNQFATERVRSNSFGINSQVTLFNGFQMYNTFKKNKLDYMAAKYDSDKMRNDIALNVATAYLQILLNRSLLEISESQIAITKQQVKRTKQMVEAGSVPKSNLLDMEAQLASEEVQKVTNQNELDIAYLNLVQLMELDSAVASFQVVEPELESPEKMVQVAGPSAIYGTALDVMPEIRSAEYRLSSSEKNLAMARGNATPKLTLNAAYGTGYSGANREIVDVIPSGTDTVGFTTNEDLVLTPSFDYEYKTKPFIDQLDDNLNQSVGLQLTIPIFNGLSARTNINRAKLNVENARYNLELQKNQLRKNIQRAYADAIAAYNKYKASEKSVTALEESFGYAKQRYDVGMMNSVDFNDAKNKLTKARSEMQQAKYDYIFKTKVLEFYQGKSLGFK